MARYVSRPVNAEYGYPTSYFEPLLVGQQVVEQEAANTGLLDANGNRIYRTMDQIGFVRAKGE